MNNPFKGNWLPSKIPLFARGRPSLPFPHPWNYKTPIRILETYFHNVDHLSSSEKHNRYLSIPGFPKVLVSRDPDVIKAILLDTGDKPGQFDRDTLPTDGIARMTGEDTLLYSNGDFWRQQKKLAAPSFGRASLFHTEALGDFEQTFRATAAERLLVLMELQWSCFKSDASNDQLRSNIRVFLAGAMEELGDVFSRCVQFGVADHVPAVDWGNGENDPTTDA